MLASLLLPITALLFRFASAQIPPELTRGFDNDTVQLVMSFGDNEVEPGDKLALANTKSVPTFSLGDSSGITPSARYIIVGIDPDAPSRANPTRAQVLHYLNTNVQPSGDGVKLNSSNETPTLAWAPPGPPEGSGPHRYVFLLYRQRPREGFRVQGVPAADSRAGFNVTEWRILNSLEPAVAGTYFEAEFGDAGAEGGGPSATGGSGALPSATGVPSAGGNGTGVSNGTAGDVIGAGSGTSLVPQMGLVWFLSAVGVAVVQTYL